MTKIAFDGQLFLKGNKTGIGWCADNLIKAIAKTGNYDCQINYFSKNYSDKVLANLEEYEKYGVKLRKCSWFNDVWYKMVWPFLRIPYTCFFGDDCQITQFFNYVIPPGVKGRKITIVHDMAHLAYPETVRPKTKRWLDLTLKSSCKRADIIITVSEFSKSEIIQYLGIPEEKIVVMYNGVDLTFFNPNYSNDKIATVAKKYGITRDYFLYLGTIEPRKNIQRIIDAYVELKKRRKNIPQLILAGGKGWLCDSIYKNVKDLNMPEDIIFTGYIAPEDSPLLISGAVTFLFPSLYEGFGTPLIESMACGTPVISANAASMPEVIGDAGLLVNPYEVEEIRESMERILDDDKLRKTLRDKGIERANQFTWDNSARVLEKVYNKVLKKEDTNNYY